MTGFTSLRAHKDTHLAILLNSKMMRTITALLAFFQFIFPAAGQESRPAQRDEKMNVTARTSWLTPMIEEFLDA
jgi:hypothetical protein